ncbi:MAG: 3,4-dihydroxy-2-butanone-4-phosphate synthase [Flavobacteriaceae bacterium]|jgi:3,4-dihydroxy 2-butanone 4-phosphate synthase / GTP cyclohydrolase II|nr:3,4-dihydroxy-2-butanone-4-phosphate synthase [Flavobacteriaceae bacterium]MDG1911321.1 3,4-dihydroxy-2-butanone-4-phosphate synthase [Flavobacteriaceae bacterium]
MTTEFLQLDTIPEAIEAIKKGEVIIVVDDANRENEGDFIAAAEKISPELINFMATHGRGLICAPLTENRCQELQLSKMVTNNTDPLETAFTVSVDLKGNGVTTGISAADRSKTIEALIDTKTSPFDLSRPGHIFPLIAKAGGVLRRTGHTEAAIDFARLAGMQPAGVIVEIMNEDGTMARLPQLIEVAKKFNLKIVSIEDLVSYRMQHDSLIEKKADTVINTRYGDFRLRAYEQTTTGSVHLALTKGHWSIEEVVLTRIHSSKITNDILGTLTGSVDKGLDDIFKLINTEGKGAVLFINQEQTSENLLNRISALQEMQAKGTLDKAPPMKMDAKDYGIGAQILHDLNIKKLCVISNSEQQRRIGITGYGITIENYKNY